MAARVARSARASGSVYHLFVGAILPGPTLASPTPGELAALAELDPGRLRDLDFR